MGSKRSRVVTIIMVAIALAIWSVMLMYPWPVVPVDDKKQTVGNLPPEKPHISVDAIQRLNLTLAVTRPAAAVVTFTNRTQNVISVYDNRRMSAYSLTVSTKESPSIRYSLERTNVMKGRAAEIPLLPGASYSREVNLSAIHWTASGTVSLSIAYQPGAIDEKYTVPKELLSNSVPWTIEAPAEDPLMEVLE